MKYIYAITLITLVVFSGCNKLKDIKLTDNPYDKDYQGPKVLKIAAISTDVIDVSHHTNILTIISTTSYYQKMDLYRSGVYLKTVFRSRYGEGTIFSETIEDNTATGGATYSYEVKLIYETSSTSFSDAYNYTTL